RCRARELGTSGSNGKRSQAKSKRTRRWCACAVVCSTNEATRLSCCHGWPGESRMSCWCLICLPREERPRLNQLWPIAISMLGQPKQLLVVVGGLVHIARTFGGARRAD